MAPAGSAGGGGSNAGGKGASGSAAAQAAKTLEPEEVLQAVLVADSFNKRYLPLTLDTPRCLLPLANIPMIEFSLEVLAMAGVQQIFLVCCHQAESIKKYIRNSRWHHSTAPLITIIVSQELLSMGDVLREMDAKQVLTSDFILMSADAVANVDLKHIMEEHKARRERDKNAIMTMVLNEVSPVHPTRSRGEEILVVLDAATDECVHFESMAPFPPKRKVALGVEMFDKHAQVVVRNDLIDCCIDICSIEVPALFTENFDYQDLRIDFLKGILESDLLGKTIYTHILTGSYAARASNLQMYDAISKDVMSRWTYPITLETNMLPGQSFEHARRHVYRERNVKLSRSAVVEELVVLGENTVVGDDSRIEGSVLGRGCIIQANSVVCGSHLFQGVRVASNCHIFSSVLAEGVVVLENTTLESGCVVGRHAVVGPNVVIPALTKITADPQQSVDARRDGRTEGGDTAAITSPDDLVERLRRNRELLGVDAQAYPYESSHSEEEEEPDLLNSRLGRMGLTQPGCAADAADAECDTDANAAFTETEDEGDWEREVEESLHRAFLESHSVDIAALELNTLKMAMNISFGDLRSVVIPIILGRVEANMTLKDLRLLLTRWGPLIGKFVHHLDDQVDTIIIISKKCLAQAPLLKHYPHLIKHLYDLDVIEEEALLKWHATLSDSKESAMARVREAISPFMRWLMEAEEESSDDD